jgi:hypothetical protein
MKTGKENVSKHRPSAIHAATFIELDQAQVNRSQGVCCLSLHKNGSRARFDRIDNHQSMNLFLSLQNTLSMSNSYIGLACFYSLSSATSSILKSDDLVS